MGEADAFGKLRRSSRFLKIASGPGLPPSQANPACSHRIPGSICDLGQSSSALGDSLQAWALCGWPSETDYREGVHQGLTSIGFIHMLA